jgi:Tfp pilus assembly protein PilX
MKPSPSFRRRGQAGIIMIIALITLAIMMVGAVAALRSMNASLSNAGNVGMKRDMANQAEIALRRAMDTVNALTTTESSNSGKNYSAKMLAVTPEGIPSVLVGSSPSTLDGVGSTANVVNLTTKSAFGDYTGPQVTMYYVVDRLCQAEGALSELGCLTATKKQQGGNSGLPLQTSTQPLYRVTVRVDGPRGAQSFYQATMSR